MGKTFLISDESINSYGFRLLSGGANFDDFKKNPVMLYGHIRADERLSGEPLLPIGRWSNIRQEGTQWLADAEFDEDDEFAMRVSKKVDKGVLNACSLSSNELEWSEDPALMLPGQVLPTITKWTVREISIADIPSNANAVRLMHKGKTISLNDRQHDSKELETLFLSNKPADNSMKSLIALLNSLNLGVTLSDEAKETDIIGGVQKMAGKHRDDLAAKDAKIVELTSQVATYKEAAQAAETKAREESAISLVDNAISAKKLLATQKDHFVKLAQADYESAKAIIDSMPAHQSISGSLKLPDGGGASKADKVKKYDELYKSNELAALKSSDWDTYADLHEAKYGKAPRK